LLKFKEPSAKAGGSFYVLYPIRISVDLKIISVIIKHNYKYGEYVKIIFKTQSIRVGYMASI